MSQLCSDMRCTQPCTRVVVWVVVRLTSALFSLCCLACTHIIHTHTHTHTHITSHRITSHHITSHHITSHRITSHHITSHHITSHHITSHHITSHHITSHHITSHHITSHHISHPALFAPQYPQQDDRATCAVDGAAAASWHRASRMRCGSEHPALVVER
jgi:hypothetical protein